MSNIMQGIWGQWQFDEAQGTRHDYSPNENDLVEQDGSGNSPAPIYGEDGLINKGVNWTLNQQNFQLRNATASMDASGGMTIAFWAKLDCVTNPNKTDSVTLALYMGDCDDWVAPYINLNIYANGNGTYPIPCLALEVWGETVDGEFDYYLSSWDWDEPTSDITKGEWHLYVLRVGSSGLFLSVDKNLYYHNPDIKTLPGNFTDIRFQGMFENLPQSQDYSLYLAADEVSLEVNEAPYLASEVTWSHIEGVKYEAAFFHEIGGIERLFHIAITTEGTKVYSNYSLIIHDTSYCYPSAPTGVTLEGEFLNYSERMQSYMLMLDEGYAWEREITEQEEDELYNDGDGLPHDGEEPEPGVYPLDVSGALGMEYQFNPVGMTIIPPTPPPTQEGGPVNPHVALQWSDDGGYTWSNEKMMPLGRVGEFRKRMKWNRLGRGRNRVFKVSTMGPIKTVLCDAIIDGDEGAD